ncbi:MAG TPA: alpha/beta hydrolase [Mycobacteriales bacterium]|jgi:acetyl esterase/lipase|nr:alpha/beta hydrolase [Mycobacteriales bacterium]
MNSVDPELAAMLPHLPQADVSDPLAARQRIRDVFATPRGARPPSWTERVSIEHASIPAADGYLIPARVYRPIVGATPRGAMVHFHGGAFIAGDLDISEGLAGRIADTTNLLVVDVDYRLAPEHPFPVGFEDCYTALEWTVTSAADLEIDVTRLAVGGESAGGALAASVAIAARDRNGPAIAYQQLLYPVIDDSLVTRSVQELVDAPMWDAPSSRLMWEHYLGPVESRGIVSPYAAPARAAESPRGLSDLPSAYILACELDPLRDEDIAYAVALMAAGVQVELHVVPGTFHGFDGLPSHIGKRTTAEYCDALRRAVGG